MKGAALYAGLCALVAALFLAVPGIDLAVSGLFYDGAQGQARVLGGGFIRSAVAAARAA